MLRGGRGRGVAILQAMTTTQDARYEALKREVGKRVRGARARERAGLTNRAWKVQELVELAY